MSPITPVTYYPREALSPLSERTVPVSGLLKGILLASGVCLVGRVWLLNRRNQTLADRIAFDSIKIQNLMSQLMERDAEVRRLKDALRIQDVVLHDRSPDIRSMKRDQQGQEGKKTTGDAQEQLRLLQEQLQIREGELSEQARVNLDLHEELRVLKEYVESRDAEILKHVEVNGALKEQLCSFKMHVNKLMKEKKTLSKETGIQQEEQADEETSLKMLDKVLEELG